MPLISITIFDYYIFICIACRYMKTCFLNSCYKPGTCNKYGLSRTYLAYHLNDKTINMDGHLDDEAWEEVPWTELFMGEYNHLVYTDSRYNDEIRYNDNLIA